MSAFDGRVALSDTHVEILESATPAQLLVLGGGALRGEYKNLKMEFQENSRVKISYEPTKAQWKEILTGHAAYKAA